MLAGQAIDTVAGKKKLEFEILIKLHQLKTGRLISASAKLGCIAAGLSFDDEKYAAATKYAENIGLAFQIIDDILSFMTLDEAKEYAYALTESGIEAISKYDDGTFAELAHYLITREF